MTYKVNDRRFRKVSANIINYLEKKLPKQAFKVFKDNTPKGDTGDARRNTDLKNTADGFTIDANYDYSGVIDRGLYPNPPKAGTGKTRNGYSTQSPKGMIDPTIEFIEKEINKRLRRSK